MSDKSNDELNRELLSALRTAGSCLDRGQFPITMRAIDAVIARADKEGKRDV